MLAILWLFACGSPSTPQERETRYINALVQDVSVYKPNESTVCYVIRGVSATNPRSLSCVSTCPATATPLR
jgi:hypothetical protein